jgi:hypothetical protein
MNILHWPLTRSNSTIHTGTTFSWIPIPLAESKALLRRIDSASGLRHFALVNFLPIRNAYSRMNASSSDSGSNR